MRKLDEVKVFRDPIHGYIHINDQVIWDCINTKEFQRLRRIHQLGTTFQVFHAAEHSRFSHSLGVYEVARRIITENEDIRKALTPYEKITVKVAALLHDIGHGPFSHTFEHVSCYPHEEYGCNIILGDSEINDALRKEDIHLAEDVAKVIRGTHPNPILCQLISSQLDADRMDYLLRDTYFTGASYGEYDLERTLRTLRVRDGKIVVKESGIHTIEDYIMARYYMYWQVYYHPVGRSYEALIHNYFRRLKEVYETDPEDVAELKMFLPLLEHSILTNKELWALDDYSCLYGIMLSIHCQDTILRDLADRIINRRLFDYDSISTIEDENQYHLWIESHGYDSDYYMYVDRTTHMPYEPYKGNEENEIWILKEDKSIEKLSTASVIVSAILNGQRKNEKKVFYPKELNE